ncbi:MAG TPA: hypothetical protein DCY29_00390 [Parabacteroides merdae]|jgi:hypothetical protein|nr:hypothetical protein DW828_20015 [Parabacteroides merdae]HAY57476.1 hypothetical protein [Parabacteroides merdae]
MNRVFNVCMFVICSLLLLSSCDKDPLMGSEEWEQERRNNFYDYKVKNREGFDMLSITPCAYNEDTAFLTGIKNEKMWIGMFDNHTKEQLKEWNGTKTVERTIKIDKGYGETELFNVTAFDFRSDIYKTNWGFTAALSYLHRENTLLTSSDIVSKDIFLLNGNEIIVYPLNYPAIANPYWFQGSIFVLNMIENCTYSIILSPDGKKIAEWKGNFVNGDFNPVPISYTEGIFIDRESDYFIIRYNYQTGKDVWKTSIPSLKGVEDNARINSTILEQSNPIWKYQIDITNYDGSKKQVIFTVDVETGEVTEI